MLSVGIKYSVRDLIFDVINYCVWSCDIRQISVSCKIIIEKDGNQINVKFLHGFLSEIWFRSVIHSLLRRTDARGSADINCYI